MEPQWGQFHVMIWSQFQWDSSTNPVDYNRYRVRPTKYQPILTQVLAAPVTFGKYTLSHIQLSSHTWQVHSQSHTALQSHLASTQSHTALQSHLASTHSHTALQSHLASTLSHTQHSSHTWQVHSQSHTVLQSYLASTLSVTHSTLVTLGKYTVSHTQHSSHTWQVHSQSHTAL